jgi:tetratricopeptide (TPR) repeat protein
VLPLLLISFLAVFTVHAHDSPEHVVEELSAKIKQLGPSGDLLYRRASEYRALRRYKSAAADLAAALKLQPESSSFCIELAEVYALDHQPGKALAQIDSCFEGKIPSGEMYMARAEIKMGLNDFSGALSDCNLAFQSEPQLEWYLVRSRIQAGCGKHQERVKHLREGIASTGSGVLEIELVEALLDAGSSHEALKLIRPQLEQNHWKSSWLIRRARAFLALRKNKQATADLKAAVAELNARTAKGAREASLMADLALAYGLMNQKKEAFGYLEMAQNLGLEPVVKDRIERLITPEKTL